MDTEKQLYSLINAAQTLTSTLDLDRVLGQLIKEVARVVEGADAVILFIYDEKLKKLVPKGGYGFDMSHMESVRLAPHEGMTGKTFSSRQAQIFTFTKDTSSGMANLMNDNQRQYQKALGRFQFPISAICAPLLSKIDCIGVLTIDSFSENIHFSERDLKILETFAAQASIAIENARLFSQIERSKNIHSKLTEVSLAQKGLKEITQTLSAIVGKQVSIYNEFLDILVVSSDHTKTLAVELKTHALHSLKEAITQRSHTQKWIELSTDHFDAFLFPIPVNQLTIGLLAVYIEEGDALDPVDLTAIEQALNIFALEMLGQDRRLADYYKHEGYLLEQLLDKQVDGFRFKQESKMELYDFYQYMFVTIEILNDTHLDFDAFNQLKHAFNRLIYRELNYFKYKVFILDHQRSINFLFVIHDHTPEEEVLKELESLFQRIHHKASQASPYSFITGFGRAFHDLEDIHISYRDTQRCLDFLKAHYNEKSIINYKELGIYRLFLKQDLQEIRDFVQDSLGELIRYCEKHSFDYLKTLKVYLESNQNMTQTSKRCYVHLNTIKYRLQGIKDILGIDDFGGSTLFELQLAIYLYEFTYKIKL